MRTLRVLVSLMLVAVFAAPTIGVVKAVTQEASQPSFVATRPSILAITPIRGPVPVTNMRADDVRVTFTNKSQNEVSVAINPTNNANLIMGANDYRGWDNLGSGAWCGVYNSFDAGAHWVMGLIPRSGALLWDNYAGDPSVAYDILGNAYFACLGFVPLPGPPYIANNTIAIAKSTDGGTSWLPPVNVVSTPAAPPFHDKPYIAIDTSVGSPYKNNIYISWTNFSSITGPGTSPIYFSRSTDGGASYSAPFKISGTQLYCQGSQPSVGPNGEIYVSFVSYSGALSKLYVVRSLDGGATFGSPVFVSNIVDPGDLPEFYRTPTLPSSATDHSTGPYGGSVYVVWQDATNGNSDIRISYSRDRGQTWSTPKKVNNDGTMNAQFFPFVSVSITGRIDVVFYDRRRDPMDFLMDVYAGISWDGGVTFGNRRITDNQINPGLDRPFIGDYIGVASLDYSFYPGWCGFVGSDEEIFTEHTLAPRFVAEPR